MRSVLVFTRSSLLIFLFTGTSLFTLGQSPPTGLVSINRFSNGGGDQFSPGDSMRVSANGRYVAFVSLATNLVPNDTNNTNDVFVRDRQTGQTILVSVNAAGTGPANVGGGNCVITPDGRYVVFMSSSDDLINDDASPSMGNTQVYIRDLQTGITRLVSRNISGTGHSNSFVDVFSGLGISDDGRFVVFTSRATDLVSTPDTNNEPDVFVRDVQTNTTRLVSMNLAGTAAGMRDSENGVISADGRFVAFTSFAKDLVSLNVQFGTQAYVRDLQTNVTKLVTPNRFGTDGTSVDSLGERDLAISADGRYVAFVSVSNDLVANDTGITQDVFVRDTQLETTTLVSINSSGTASGTGNSGQISMTPDGRFVAFVSGADNLVANDSNLQQDIFVRDLQLNTTSLISINNGAMAGGTGFPDTQFLQRMFRPSISADGRYVGFTSKASDLISGPDTNGGAATLDVFIRDRQTNTTRLVSTNFLGTDSGSGGAASYPLVNSDGKLVFYFSGMRDLVGFDSNNVGDLFCFSNLQQPDQIRFKTALTNVNESSGSATVSVVLTSAPSNPVSVNFSTTNGSALNGTDYVATSGTLSFAAGETEKTFSVSILDDATVENDETIIVRLSDASSGIVLGEPNIAAIKIVDDEPPPTLRINDITTFEGDLGQFNFQITVSLSSPTERPVSVILSTQSGTASANVDFVAGSQLVNFAPGQTSKTATVVVIGDTIVEGLENFFVNLTSPVNATITDSQGVVTIVDDDALLLLTEESSQRAIALDSVLLTRDSFAIGNDLNFSSDHITRISLFAVGLKLSFGESASAVVATAEDSQGNIWPLTVESVQFVPNASWLQQVVVKLNNQITLFGDIKIKFTLHGTPSNTVLVGIRQ